MEQPPLLPTLTVPGVDSPYGTWEYCSYCRKQEKIVPAPRWRGFRGAQCYFLCDQHKESSHADFDYIGDMKGTEHASD